MPYPYFNQQPQAGFVCVRSMAEVDSWPVAPGNAITFYVEGNPPLIATKAKGFSPIENPVVKVYDLTERRQSVPAAPEGNVAGYALKSDLEAVRRELEALRVKLEGEHE